MGTGYKAHHCVECGSSYYGGMTGQPIACPYCVIIELRKTLECVRDLSSEVLDGKKDIAAAIRSINSISNIISYNEKEASKQ